METNTLLTGIICIILFLMLLFVMAWYLWEIGKKNAKKARVEEMQYKAFYSYVQIMLQKWEVNEKSYCVILKFIERIKNMGYKNPEKTEVLENEFLEKYKSIKDEIRSREEFTFEAVLKK